MRCSSLPVPSVQSVSACVWPRVKRAEPWVRGITVTSDETAGSRSRSGRRDGACRPRSWCGRSPCRACPRPTRRPRGWPGRAARCPARPARRATGTAAATVATICSISACRLADFSSLESCSASVSARMASPNCSLTGPYTACVAGLGDQLLEGELDALAVQHVGLGRGARDLGQLRLGDRVGLRPAGRPGRARRSPTAARPAWLLRSDSVTAPSIHLGCPRARRRSICSLAEPLDLAVGELERLDQHVLADLLGAGLDHRDRLGRAADDQVEIRLLGLGHVRVDHQLAVDAADANGADRAHERQRGQHQRRGGAVDRQDVVRVHLVGGERGHDDLDLVLVALRPQRPDRPVDHPRVQDRLLAGAALALEEPARDLARRRTSSLRRRR